MAHDKPVVAPVELHSRTWFGPVVPRIAVLVPTYRRPGFVPEIIAALEAQDLPSEQFEVVLVDDASGDETWEVASRCVEVTSLRMAVTAQDQNRGPAAARNLAVNLSRADLLAFTDDDCLPLPGWLSGMLQALETGAPVVQGRVTPPLEDWVVAGPWDHTIWVEAPSPFFETANVGYRRDRFLEAGGFDDRDPLLTPEEGRGFGEDAELAWRVLREGGSPAFNEQAVVHHRVIPRDYLGCLRAQRHTRGFPGLARRSPIFARWLRARVFLTWYSATFDLAIVAVALSAFLGQPWMLAGTAPWVVLRGRETRLRTARNRLRAPLVFAQYAIVDLVTLVSLVEGGIRHRRLVL